MIPVLFKGNETNFNHNGIGLLKDTLSCEVSEGRNGSFDLELVYPITGPYFKDLKNGNIVQAKPNDTDLPHNFRITEIDKTLYDKEVVVYGVSITNDLGGNMVKSLYLEDVTPQVILNEMKNVLHYPTTFNFVSNITTVGTVYWELNNPLNLIVGEEGSLVDIFGGEVKRTNDILFLYGRRGKDNVTTIRAGKNLDGFKMTESFQGKYTQILPYFKYEAEIPSDIPGDSEGATTRQEFTVFGSIVSSPYHGRYPVNAIKPIDFSQNEYVRELKTLEALNEVASEYFSDLYSEIDKPSVSINVDMIQLVDSEQYELYEKLEKIELTDTVSVYIPEYDVDVLVKITELKYDSLRERTISIVAGSSGRTSLIDEISGSYKQFTKTLVDDKIQSATSGIINQILTKKDGGNVYAGRATPPDNAKLGDIWFKDTGGGDVELYEFDGVNWVRKMYKGFGDDVRQLVDDKIAEANALFTGAIDEQAEVVEQVNALAQLAKTEAANASLSAAAANQDTQQAIAQVGNTRTELLGLVSTLDSKAEELTTKSTNLQNQVDSNTLQITQQSDQIALKAEKTYVDTIKQTVDSHTTSITQQADQIALKADNTTVNNLTGRITNAESSITQQADQIALKANQTELNNLTGRVTNAESSITQQAGQIALKAEKTYVDTVKQTVDSTTSRVTLTEDSITGLVSGVKTLPDGRTSVFATKIESLEGAITQRVTTQELNNRGYQTGTDVTNTINNRTDLAKKTDIPTTLGGRNLAQKTSADWSTPYTSFSGTVNTCPYLYKVLIDDLVVGDTLKSRIVLKYTNIIPASGQTVGIWLQGDGNITRWNAGSYNSSPARTISGSGAIVFEHEFKITEDHLKNSYWNWMFRTDYIASGSLQWKLAKVEKGPLWTAWTPAHEDTEASITDKLTGYVTNQTYTTYTTTRQQTDVQITEQINQTVSKVPTGPVNLVVNGFDPQTISPWKPGHSDWTLELTKHGYFYNGTKKLMRFKTSTATSQGTFESNIYNLKRNTKYTIRVGIFANSNCKELRFCFGRGTSTSISDYSMAHPWFFGNSNYLEYKTITVDSGNYDYGKLTFDHRGTKTVGQSADMYIAEISIIEGEYNNSWTPSFDELITEQKFNETKSTVDAFSRAIGTRDENGFVPNITSLVMNQNSFITEVAKYGEHNNNLIQDAEKFSTTRAINGTSISNYMPSRISWKKTGATSNIWAGIGIPVNVKRFIAGEKYTISFDYYFYTAPDDLVFFSIKDHTNNVEYTSNAFGDSTTPVGVWRHFEKTFSISTGTAANTYIQDAYLYGRRNSDVAIKDIMLVRGEKIGPFSTSQVDNVSTRVEQTANSYSIKFLNGANDITTQLNLTNSGARIKSSLIHLDGNVTVSGTAWMDGAVIKNLSADKITTGTLNANNVTITNLSVNSVSGITATYLESVIGNAFIDWMRGKMITSQNNNTIFNLNEGTLTFGSDHTGIYRRSGSIHSESGLFFLQSTTVVGGVNRGHSRTIIGSERRGGNVNVDWMNGGFNGIILDTIRGVSSADHDAADRISVIADRIDFKHTYLEDSTTRTAVDMPTGWRMNNYIAMGGGAVEFYPININPRNSSIKAGDFFLFNGYNNGEYLRVILERMLHNTQELSNRTGGRNNIYWSLDHVMNNRLG